MERKRHPRTDEVVDQVRQIGNETGLLRDRKWAQLAEALNARGITTPGGPPWTGSYLATFVKREGLIALSVTEHDAVLATTEPASTNEPVTYNSHTTTHREVQDTVTQANTDHQVLEAHTEAHIPNVQDNVLPSRTLDEMPEGELPLSKTSPVLFAHAESHTDLDPETIQGLKDMLAWWRSRKDKPMELIKDRPLFHRDPSVTRSVRISKDLALDAERYALKHVGETGGSFSGLVEILLWLHLGSNRKYLKKDRDAAHE
ncbi:MAG: hypothetical protein FJY85_11350 [Deltaproteobacteria bacterium]|nr:hypothetical protein [Deltaproteobacteria bacterium]